jgi:hypothetical protein
MMLHLNPPIPLDTPKGVGRAVVLIDRSEDHDLEWVTFIDATGECWTFRNQEIRQIENRTMGRSAGAGARSAAELDQAPKNE